MDRTKEVDPTESRVGFGPRLGAWLIDLLLLAGVALVLAPQMSGWAGAGLARVTEELAKNPGAAGNQTALVFARSAWLWSVALTVCGILYAVVEGLTGRTVGKLVLGLRVGTARGLRAAVPRLMARAGIKAGAAVLSAAGLVTGVEALGTVSGVVGIVVLVGCGLVLGRRKQALHDLAAGTAVYRSHDLALGTDPGPAPTAPAA